MGLGNKLLELRKKKGLSQEEVAYSLGVSRQTVSKWETGQSQPEFDRIKPLAELYDVSIEELITGKSAEEVIIDNAVGKDRKKSALMLIASIFLYFLSVIAIVVLSESGVEDSISVGIFLFLCAIATCLIVYRGVIYNSDKRKEETHEPENIKLRIVKIITTISTLLVYLSVSFLTNAWHLTWIIWIIYAVAVEIIKLLFLLKEEKENE